MCDALMHGSNCLRENEVIAERALDGMDLEKERFGEPRLQGR